MVTRFLIFVFLLSLLALSSCGDLGSKKVVKRELDSSIAEVSCKLNIDAFTKILHQSIENDIRCLGENLNLFIRIVKTDKPGSISRTQLESYLNDFRPDVKPEVKKAIGAVFQLGHLITGEDPDYISKDTVDKVINFAIVFNKQAAFNFDPTFGNESEDLPYSIYVNNRKRVSAASLEIVKALRPVLNLNRNGRVDKLNLVELLDIFTSDSNRENMEKLKKMLFLKRVILGGESTEITHIELRSLIENFDSLLLIALDIVQFEKIKLDRRDIIQLVKEDVEEAFAIITEGSLNSRDDVILFTVNEALDAFKSFIGKDDFDVDQYHNLIIEAKKLLMKGDEATVKGIDLKRLFDHAKTLLGKGTVFYRIYDKLKAHLDQTGPVTIDFSDFRHSFPDNQDEFDQFERIVKNYRFMKGEFFSSYYTQGYKRNPDAVFEIATFEYILEIFFKAYGTKSPGPTVGGYSMDKTQMENLIKKFENELIDMGLILPKRSISTANNISLLASLFQYQSDTNELMDVNEATEFAVSLLSSMNVADSLMEYMKEQKCSVDQFERVDASCFRENFWKGVCSGYRNNYPLMFTSLDAPKKCEDWVNTQYSQEFLDRSIRAGRSCMNYQDGQKEEIPYSSGDIMTLMVVLLHSETTILRWDENKNNMMDPSEVDRSYAIYGPALDGFLTDKPTVIKKLKKQIFQYMIRYEKVPDESQFSSTAEFVRFLMNFNKKSSANRKTISSLLMAIGDQNALLQTGPKFDCSLLRDPDHIPRSFQ